jgi:hypothetical protein
MTRVRVDLDQLVLRGFQPRDAEVLWRTLREDLSRSLSDPALRPGLADSRRVPVVHLEQRPASAGAAGARMLGKGIATELVRGLKR